MTYEEERKIWNEYSKNSCRIFKRSLFGACVGFSVMIGGILYPFKNLEKPNALDEIKVTESAVKKLSIIQEQEFYIPEQFTQEFRDTRDSRLESLASKLVSYVDSIKNANEQVINDYKNSETNINKKREYLYFGGALISIFCPGFGILKLNRLSRKRNKELDELDNRYGKVEGEIK